MAGGLKHFSELDNLYYYVFKFYSRSWLVKTQLIIYRISKMTCYFICWRHQRAIITCFGPNVGPKQSIIACCRTQPPALRSLLKFPPKLNIVLRVFFWFWIHNKTIIEFSFRMISRLIKASVCGIHLSLRLRRITKPRPW